MIRLVGEIGALDYTRCQITLYRMFFADFSVNSQPIAMTESWSDFISIIFIIIT